MDYPTISDPAQLQLLEHLLRIVLHGIQLSIGIASVCLLGGCISELRMTRRDPADVPGHERRTSGHAMSKMGQGEPGSLVIQHSSPIGYFALRGDIR